MVQALSSPFLSMERYPVLGAETASSLSRLVYKVAIVVTAIFFGALFGGWIAASFFPHQELMVVAGGALSGALLTPLLLRWLYIPSRYPQYFSECLKEFSRRYREQEGIFTFLQTKLVCETIAFENHEQMQEFYQYLEHVNSFIKARDPHASSLWRDFLVHLGHCRAFVSGSSLPVKTSLILAHFFKAKEGIFSTSSRVGIEKKKEEIDQLISATGASQDSLERFRNTMASLKPSSATYSGEKEVCFVEEQGSLLAVASLEKTEYLLGGVARKVLKLQEVFIHPEATILRDQKTLFLKILKTFSSATHILKIVPQEDQKQIQLYTGFGFTPIPKSRWSRSTEITLVYSN